MAFLAVFASTAFLVGHIASAQALAVPSVPEAVPSLVVTPSSVAIPSFVAAPSSVAVPSFTAASLAATQVDTSLAVTQEDTSLVDVVG